MGDNTFQSMLGEDDGQPQVFVESGQRREHFLGAPRVELTGRLVQGQDRGLQGERGGNRHPLPLPAGKGSDLSIAQCRDAE